MSEIEKTWTNFKKVDTIRNEKAKPSMVAPICNHSTQEAETGKPIHVEPSLDDTDHPGLTNTTQWDPVLEVKEGGGRASHRLEGDRWNFRAGQRSLPDI